MSGHDETGSPRRYVVGVDGSAASLEALRWAVAETRAHGGDIRAVLVWELAFSGLSAGTSQGPYGLADTTILEKEASVRLQSCIEAVGDTSPVKVRAQVYEGQPAAVLGEMSRDADFVVVGARGHGGFKALLLGSVSAQIVHHAHCSVVVIRPPAEQ